MQIGAKLVNGEYKMINSGCQFDWAAHITGLNILGVSHQLIPWLLNFWTLAGTKLPTSLNFRLADDGTFQSLNIINQFIMIYLSISISLSGLSSVPVHISLVLFLW